MKLFLYVLGSEINDLQIRIKLDGISRAPITRIIPIEVITSVELVPKYYLRGASLFAYCVRSNRHLVGSGCLWCCWHW